MDINRLDVALAALAAWIVYKIVVNFRLHWKATQLRGPTSWNLIFGLSPKTMNDMEGQQIEKWAKEYGPVFQIPSFWGAKKIIIMDPRAISHFSSLDTTRYIHTRTARAGIETVVRSSAQATFGMGSQYGLGRERTSLVRG